ncbi:MAG: hypothetical protein SVV80_00560 [Planctomycetota bacterium]|nr:hypothetical protein [Planctomycetota bacterium]
MSSKKVTFREVLQDTLSLFSHLLDKLPESWKTFSWCRSLWVSKEASNALQMELGLIHVFCFFDAVRPLKRRLHAWWADQFCSAIAWPFSDELANRFYGGDKDACWTLFKKRLYAFNESSRHIGKSKDSS